MVKRFFLGFLVFLFSNLFTFSCPPLLEAVSPEIDSITPVSGSSITPIQIVINGSGFKAIPKISIYGGGPYITGSCDTPGTAKDIHVSDNYAYVADLDAGLQIIDISDPVNPGIVGF